MLTHKVINKMNIDELRSHIAKLQELISAYHVALNGYEQQVELLKRQAQDEVRIISLNNNLGKIEMELEEKYYSPPTNNSIGESE